MTAASGEAVEGGSDTLVSHLRQELSCPLCHGLFDDPHTAPGCGHSFCYACVIGTLEGPGIAESRCPVCRMPLWKKDLQHNYKYQNLVREFRAFLDGLAAAHDPSRQVPAPAPLQGASRGSPASARSPPRPPTVLQQPRRASDGTRPPELDGGPVGPARLAPSPVPPPPPPDTPPSRRRIPLVPPAPPPRSACNPRPDEPSSSGPSAHGSPLAREASHASLSSQGSDSGDHSPALGPEASGGTGADGSEVDSGVARRRRRRKRGGRRARARGQGSSGGAGTPADSGATSATVSPPSGAAPFLSSEFLSAPVPSLAVPPEAPPGPSRPAWQGPVALRDPTRMPQPPRPAGIPPSQRRAMGAAVPADRPPAPPARHPTAPATGAIRVPGSFDMMMHSVCHEYPPAFGCAPPGVTGAPCAPPLRPLPARTPHVVPPPPGMPPGAASLDHGAWMDARAPCWTGNPQPPAMPGRAGPAAEADPALGAPAGRGGVSAASARAAAAAFSQALARRRTALLRALVGVAQEDAVLLRMAAGAQGAFDEAGARSWLRDLGAADDELAGADLHDIFLLFSSIQNAIDPVSVDMSAGDAGAGGEAGGGGRQVTGWEAGGEGWDVEVGEAMRALGGLGDMDGAAEEIQSLAALVGGTAVGVGAGVGGPWGPGSAMGGASGDVEGWMVHGGVTGTEASNHAAPRRGFPCPVEVRGDAAGAGGDVSGSGRWLGHHKAASEWTMRNSVVTPELGGDDAQSGEAGGFFVCGSLPRAALGQGRVRTGLEAWRAGGAHRHSDGAWDLPAGSPALGRSAAQRDASGDGRAGAGSLGAGEGAGWGPLDGVGGLLDDVLNTVLGPDVGPRGSVRTGGVVVAMGSSQGAVGATSEERRQAGARRDGEGWDGPLALRGPVSADTAGGGVAG